MNYFTRTQARILANAEVNYDWTRNPLQVAVKDIRRIGRADRYVWFVNTVFCLARLTRHDWPAWVSRLQYRYCVFLHAFWAGIGCLNVFVVGLLQTIQPYARHHFLQFVLVRLLLKSLLLDCYRLQRTHTLFERMILIIEGRGNALHCK